jgi:AcrR family transcriptional regulator
MAEHADPLAAAAVAAVALAAERPWRDVTLRDVVRESGLPMAAFYGVARSKDDVVDAMLARLDKATAETLELDSGASLRERVFDAAMARFDAMEKDRAGVASILRAEVSSPLGAARMWPRASRTARWLLELAGVDTSGALGAARVQGFTLILARATRAWLKDDGGDLSRTMATLDRALRDAEAWGERLSGARPKAEGETASHGEATSPARPGPDQPSPDQPSKGSA